MSLERSDHLLELVKPIIKKKDTNFHKSIPASERLTITLRFLETRDSQQPLSFSYRLGKATVSKFISATCKAI